MAQEKDNDRKPIEGWDFNFFKGYVKTSLIDTDKILADIPSDNSSKDK